MRTCFSAGKHKPQKQSRSHSWEVGQTGGVWEPACAPKEKNGSTPGRECLLGGWRAEMPRVRLLSSGFLKEGNGDPGSVSACPGQCEEKACKAARRGSHSKSFRLRLSISWPLPALSGPFRLNPFHECSSLSLPNDQPTRLQNQKPNLRPQRKYKGKVVVLHPINPSSVPYTNPRYRRELSLNMSESSS